jgi:hypothetical protein
MAAAVAIAILDAQGTPVSHNFVPIGTDKNGVFWFEDQSSPSAIGYWKISIERKAPAAAQPGASSDGRTYRYKVGLHEPILANVTNSTVSGVLPAPTLAYVPRVVTEFIIPERSALIDRQNLAKMQPLLIQNAQIKTLIETLGILN